MEEVHGHRQKVWSASEQQQHYKNSHQYSKKNVDVRLSQQLQLGNAFEQIEATHMGSCVIRLDLGKNWTIERRIWKWWYHCYVVTIEGSKHFVRSCNVSAWVNLGCVGND